MTRASIDRDASSSRDYSINVAARARFRARDFQDREAPPSNSWSDYGITRRVRRSRERRDDRRYKSISEYAAASFGRVSCANRVSQYYCGRGVVEGIETKFVP